MITLALALAGTGPLSNVTLGMSPSDDTFATCVAQAATTQVIAPDEFFKGFVFKSLGVPTEEGDSLPSSRADLSFWASAPGANGAMSFSVILTSLDTANGWSIAQDASGNYTESSASVDRTGYVVQQGGGTPLNLGTIDVGACASRE